MPPSSSLLRRENPRSLAPAPLTTPPPSSLSPATMSGREEAAEKHAPAAVVAAGVVAATAHSAPSSTPAPTAIAAAGIVEQVVADVATDLVNKGKRKRTVFDDIDDMYKDAAIDIFRDAEREDIEFEEEISDELPEENDSEMGDDKDSRDNKSRYILRRQRGREIKYRCAPYGKIFCPFCGRVLGEDFKSLIEHAKAIGMGSAVKHQAKTKASHAAFAVFLRKYVQGLEPFYVVQPPPQEMMPKKAKHFKKAKH